MSKITVVVGGQFGSEGKGAITGHIAEQSMGRGTVTGVTRVAGPNAGHTAYDAEGRKWALRQVPVGAVTNLDALLFIGPGSEIDISVLQAEVVALDDAGLAVSERLYIDRSATMLTSEHHARETTEGLTGRIGSTGKGIGAARADRIMRTARLAENVPDLQFLGAVVDTIPLQNKVGHLIIEGTQGYGLGLHTPNYPKVTSSDCRAIDFLAMAGISPWALYWSYIDVVVVARAYPIRVAGNSGALKGETTWAELGLAAERTTVTQKIRRVGAWDADLVRSAVRENGGHPTVRLALTMADQVFPGMAGVTERDPEHTEFEHWVISRGRDAQARVAFVGTSPTTVIEWSQG